MPKKKKVVRTAEAAEEEEEKAEMAPKDKLKEILQKKSAGRQAGLKAALKSRQAGNKMAKGEAAEATEGATAC
jgi:hypothetical protein